MTATEKLEITAVDARDFKRLSEVRVETGGHRNLLLIAGKNTAGKSSLMDALTVALGGKDALPPDPVRRGADKAVVTVELDGGRYTITRTVTGRGKDLKTSLRVVGPDGVISAPQTWLDGIVAGRFLDPVAFLALPADRQRQALLALVGVDVAAIDAERKRVYDERTAVNRDAKAAAARRAGGGRTLVVGAGARSCGPGRRSRRSPRGGAMALVRDRQLRTRRGAAGGGCGDAGGIRRGRAQRSPQRGVRPGCAGARAARKWRLGRR